MTHENHPDDSPQVADTDVTDNAKGETDAADAPPSAPAPAPAASQPPVSAAPTAAPVAAQPSNLAELSAQLREAAAEIAEIAAQAGRLGIAIDAAKALREGTAPEALRRLVLERASAAADARDIVAAAPSPVLPKSTESPIVAAAKKAASAGSRG
jgi:hypothetical protein